MAHRITWNGTHQETLALLNALSHHCTCQIEAERMVKACAGHTMLACDQRALDGLLFMRRIAERLLAEEFHLTDAALSG